MRRGGSLAVFAALVVVVLAHVSAAGADQHIFIDSSNDGSVVHGMVDNGGNQSVPAS